MVGKMGWIGINWLGNAQCKLNNHIFTYKLPSKDLITLNNYKLGGWGIDDNKFIFDITPDSTTTSGSPDTVYLKAKNYDEATAWKNELRKARAQRL